MDCNSICHTFLIRDGTHREAYERAKTMWLASVANVPNGARRTRHEAFCYRIWPLDGVQIERDINLSINAETIYPNMTAKRSRAIKVE